MAFVMLSETTQRKEINSSAGTVSSSGDRSQMRVRLLRVVVIVCEKPPRYYTVDPLSRSLTLCLVTRAYVFFFLLCMAD